MRDFDRYAKFSKRDSGRRSFEKQMHEVTCDECGKRCEVPFKPSGDKPVYCSDCFEKRGDSGRGSYNRSGGRDSGRFSRRDSGSNKPEQFIKEFDQLNRKLDTILKALEVSKPVAEEPKEVEKPVKKPKKTEKKVVKKKEKPKTKKKKEIVRKKGMLV